MLKESRFFAVACASLLACSSPESLAPEVSERSQAIACSNCGQPLPGLTEAQLAAFLTGEEDFEEVEDVEDGIGPVFNEAGCANCHNAPAVGGSGAIIETRFGRVTGGVFDPLTELGGSLRQDHGVGELGVCGLPAEVTPAVANVVGGRRTTGLFGLGLVEAVPDALLAALAASQPVAIRGTAHWITDVATGARRVGRFGWKNQIATLLTFAGDAYLNEMGITSPIFPEENCPQGDCSKLAACDTVADPEDDGTSIDNFTNFMRLLAPPARSTPTLSSALGEVLFLGAGCAGCHTPVLVTGSSPIEAIAHRSFQPYSDFLLHDMGALGDGITQGAATGRLMRTAPLWGVSSQPSLLHDGRTSSLDAAIRAHDGQGRAARDRYTAMSSLERAAVIAFLRSL